MKKQSLPCIKLLKLICITKVGLVFLSSNFVINKISQGRKSVHGLSAAIYLRTVGQFATLEKSQVLGTFFFLSVPYPLFFQVCRTIFLCAKEMEIQVLDQNTMCIWSPNLMTPRGFFCYLWEFIILFIWNQHPNGNVHRSPKRKQHAPMIMA